MTPTEKELDEEKIEENEDARVAAEEGEEVAEEDTAAARDAREGRIPSP